MTMSKAIVLLAAGAVFLVANPSGGIAADMGVTPAKKASVRVIHHGRARVVRDYDGTAVIERRVRSVRRLPDGTVAVATRTEMIPSLRAEPGRYFNGEPVLPYGARHPQRIVVRPYR
jgi:hypothetical protein